MALEIRLVEDIEQMSKLSDFFQDIWANGPEVVPFDIGYAILHVGGYASLAYQDEKLVGASFGVRGVHNNQQVLHSHVTASLIPGVGFELKQHQFNWAKENNIPAITWTFDPLVRRNCAFNLVKLGATAIEFLPNFYGTMTDDINAGDVSDRLFAIWPTNLRSVKEVGPKIENIALADNLGIPELNHFDSAKPFAVYLPEDIEFLRKSDLGLVNEWRKSVNQILRDSFRAGCQIDQMIDQRRALLITPASYN